MEGFIQLHRKIIEWDWYEDTNTFKLFIHCLLKANHKDKNWRGQTIKRGSFITSNEKLSNETGLSIMQVRTSLKKLEKTQEINKQTTSLNTCISISNYNDYQNSNKRITYDITSKQQASNKRVTTTNNDNNDNNDNNIPSREEFTSHALSKKDNLDEESIRLKYEAWVENGWKDGNDKPIKNWKSKLTNTIPYLKAIEKPKYSGPSSKPLF